MLFIWLLASILSIIALLRASKYHITCICWLCFIVFIILFLVGFKFHFKAHYDVDKYTIMVGEKKINFKNMNIPIEPKVYILYKALPEPSPPLYLDIYKNIYNDEIYELYFTVNENRIRMNTN